MNRWHPIGTLLLLGFLLLPAPLTPDVSAAPIIGVHTVNANDQLLNMAHHAGVSWVIQLVAWRDVEPTPGELFWEYTDWLVRAAEYYGLELIMRLDHPPVWAVSPDERIPVDLAAYADFVGRVAARYRGRVAAYAVWNEPNLTIEWVGQVPNPAGYVDLLCAAHASIRAADPQALVISAGLAPTNRNDDVAMDDRVFLLGMYGAQGAACFDVLGAHPYGFAYTPDDPYAAHEGRNFARLSDLRAIMVDNADSTTPVWATELGWTTSPAAEEEQWLAVSEEQQSDYLQRAFDQAAHHWPWLERIAVWNLSIGLPQDDEKRGYSLLHDDGAPKLAYEALAAMTAGLQSTEKREYSGAVERRPSVEIVAPDVIIRLSDVDTFYPHWARPSCATVPCRRWHGTFYVEEPDLGSWRLLLEVMQVEEPGNIVWINGQPLEPPTIPLRGRPDFASVWTALEMTVPSGAVRRGSNTLEVWSSPRLPLYQSEAAQFESLQLRHLHLVSDSW